MCLDLKIQDKSLKEMKPLSSLANWPGKFHFTKSGLTIFARTLPIFLRVFPNFTVSTKSYL